jgi:hypothetical protein
MLIITDEDKKMLLAHLKVLKMYYRSQVQLHKGRQLGNLFASSMQDLNFLIISIGGEEAKHATDEE